MIRVMAWWLLRARRDNTVAEDSWPEDRKALSRSLCFCFDNGEWECTTDFLVQSCCCCYSSRVQWRYSVERRIDRVSKVERKSPTASCAKRQQYMISSSCTSRTVFATRLPPCSPSYAPCVYATPVVVARRHEFACAKSIRLNQLIHLCVSGIGPAQVKWDTQAPVVSSADSVALRCNVWTAIHSSSFAAGVQLQLAEPWLVDECCASFPIGYWLRPSQD